MRHRRKAQDYGRSGETNPTELLSSHLQTRASGSRLRQRVNELLRASVTEAGEGSDGELAAEAEDLEDFDPRLHAPVLGATQAARIRLQRDQKGGRNRR